MTKKTSTVTVEMGNSLEELIRELKRFNDRAEAIDKERKRIKRNIIKSDDFIELEEVLNDMFEVNERSHLTSTLIKQKIFENTGMNPSLVFLGHVLSETFKDNIRQKDGRKGYTLKLK